MVVIVGENDLCLQYQPRWQVGCRVGTTRLKQWLDSSMCTVTGSNHSYISHSIIMIMLALLAGWCMSGPTA